MNRNRLAVLGSPISHSKSPLLHRAAYAALSLDWQYEAVEVTGATLPGFLASRDESWRGLSLTMPLKRDVLPLLDETDAVAATTGGANTVLFDVDPAGNRRLRGFNTDVFGIRRAFTEVGVDSLRFVHVLGAGATAASVIAAAAALGATRATVYARNPEKAHPLRLVGERLGVEIDVQPWGTSEGPGEAPDAVISTLPGGAEIDLAFAGPIRARSVLFDVSYDPWPSPLASAWLEVGGRVISGLDMLVLQALAQVRIFVSGDPEQALPNESAVLAAMRSAVSA
ncbi:MAG: shikimate dehydrogenase [Glaciihabitans sp.]|nr:shikimate dehydrogenase [Glaciihabitans sp.]